MFVKKNIAISSGYTVDKKLKIHPSVIINDYISNYSKKIPSNINHDVTRTCAFTTKGPLIFKDGTVYQIINFNIPETEDDFSILNKVVSDNHNDFVNESKEKFIEFENKLIKYLSPDTKKVKSNSIQFYDKDIVKKMFPELKGDKKHNLIDLKLLKKESYNNYSYKGYLIYPHEYFRRSYYVGNSINDEFLNVLNALGDEKNLDVKIAIDYNLIGYLGTEKKNIELQYWWGPKFDDNLADIQVGVTTHQMNEEAKFYNQIIKTDFFWYNQNDLKTLEVEEVVDYSINRNNNSYYPSRFIHCMLDKNNKPNHIDGAIRLYSEDKHLIRINQTIDKTRRDTEYIKIWRVDGDIPIAKWKELLTHYYRDNKLIGEYLGGIDDIYSDEHSIRPTQDNQNNNFNFFIFKIVNIKIDFYDNNYIVSFNNDGSLPHEVRIDNNDFYNKVIFDLHKSKKTLIESNTNVINSIIKNTPLFLCDSNKDFNIMLEIINEIITKNNKLYSFTIGIYLEEKLKLFSFFGDNIYLKNLIEVILSNKNRLNNISLLLEDINKTFKNDNKSLQDFIFDLLY